MLPFLHSVSPVVCDKTCGTKIRSRPAHATLSMTENLAKVGKTDRCPRALVFMGIIAQIHTKYLKNTKGLYEIL